MSSINEITNFLQSWPPDQLARMRRPGSTHADVLKPDMARVAAPATKFKAEAALLALTLLQPELPRLLAAVLARARKASAGEDIAAILTIVAGAVTSALSFLPPQYNWLKLAAALTTVAASAFTLYAKRQARTLFDQSPGTQAAVLVDAGTSVRQWLIELQAYLDPADSTDHTIKVETILDKANLLFRDLNRARVDIDRTMPS